ncbi:MAG: NADPH-dependent reductase [Candidatus Saccharibacteria bacterium]|nr:NADPH-dependent reductase [Candidatus Saccharibacteria bacterium]
MTKIAVFVGSLQKNSFNMLLAQNLEKLAGEGVEFDYIDLNLPLFNQDIEASAYPAEAQAMKDKVAAADGVLFVTPEYNRSFPGVLKNAIDWVSRPWGHNSLDRKPTAIVGASPTPNGTNQAQQQLRNILIYLNTKLLGQPEVYFAAAHQQFDENGDVVEAAKESLQTFMATFTAWVEDKK